ncbi:peptidoglycan editing factor PgeF [Chitiniphilus purpureus]|uniref:Purine nucleoside phosphorylase n=1 Tax=Chitiniphilus purpureus TaxID=2981137 RepID=A0ABY6DZ56_9NEIS|nr:peptidoglycan editing factor PgeF [Chitiniphilus sp. CD1]UXY17128.1 peptidoglycan editing factor PgeF [Chitiniphilus sp. CD1]
MSAIEGTALLRPDWPAPPTVRAWVTTRAGGVSQPPFASLNLGDHVGDDPHAVSRNRALLRAHLPADPVWLTQVHGIAVADATSVRPGARADAVIARQAEAVCAILTADCLPVLLCDVRGSVVGAAHAGWRGLADGVIEATVAAMAVPPDALLAWLGPAIGPATFEVGDEVRARFVADQPVAEAAFRAAATPGKWWADLYGLARLRLMRLGVRRIYGGNFCTASDEARFFSYRRDGVTGRMASLIWLTAAT